MNGKLLVSRRRGRKLGLHGGVVVQSTSSKKNYQKSRSNPYVSSKVELSNLNSRLPAIV
jgi:hypothetical protein